VTQSVTYAQMRLIRFCLLGGILLFGLVAGFVATGTPEGISLNVRGPLVPAVALTVLAAAGVVMFVRRKLVGILSLTKRAPILIAGHVACEVAAFLGGVHLLVTGGLMPYVAGLVVFVFSLVLLPIKHG